MLLFFSVVCCVKVFCIKDGDFGKEFMLGNGELFIGLIVCWN